MSLTTFLESVGTYVAVKFDEESTAKIVALQQSLRLNNPLDKDKFHTTILFSRKAIPAYSTDTVYEGTITFVESWEGADGENAVVAKIDCPALVERHNDLIDVGGTHDYPEYQPHVTLSYDDTVNPLPVSISVKMVDEYVEDLDLNWKDKV